MITQALITCTKVLAPFIDSQLCQEQHLEACELVGTAVEKILLAAQVCMYVCVCLSVCLPVCSTRDGICSTVASQMYSVSSTTEVYEFNEIIDFCCLLLLCFFAHSSL